MRKIQVLIIILSISRLTGILSQEKHVLHESPKLVVGIVVDQMRYDYLTRFYHRFGEGGFKRLLSDGFNCKNNHFSYIPTYTGPGHASIFTGTTPRNHGIIANNWYDKFSKTTVYCASDPSVSPVGSQSEKEKMSPHRMKTTTFSDQNRLHTQFKGKTIGIAIKDRGAILPAGHTANAAYWFRGKDEGKWITTTYYKKELPKWVKKFNASNKAKSYLKVWETLYNIDSYIESGPDQSDFERGFVGKDTPTFPYDFKKLSSNNEGYDIIKVSPFGNSLTTDFAIAAIEGEALGKDHITDVLTLSFSSTDYVGHNFGVNSKEIQDTYLRLDKDLERLLETLDNMVGKGQYTLFLTADHGAVHVPSYLKSVKIPAGYLNEKSFVMKMKEFIKTKFKAEDLIENISNNQVFFNYQNLQQHGIDRGLLQRELSDFLIQQEQVDKIFTRDQLVASQFTSNIAAKLYNGFHQRRSGDLIIVYNPGTIIYPEKGSTHGSGQSYDTHTPLLFFGKGIKKGSTTLKTNTQDIAPTISALLGIAFPNGATGDVLSNIIE